MDKRRGLLIYVITESKIESASEDNGQSVYSMERTKRSGRESFS